jgi:hypothetical protein
MSHIDYQPPSAPKMMTTKVDLILPSITGKEKPTTVALLCSSVASWRNQDQTEILIQGRSVSDLEVSKVLFKSSAQCSKKVNIFQCKMPGLSTSSSKLCLKLMNSDEIFQREMKAYERMMEKNASTGERGVESLFLPVYFFCEVTMPDNSKWKGYCMQEGKYSLKDILFPADTISGALEQKKVLNTILQDKGFAMRFPITNTIGEDGGGGEPVIFQAKQSLELSIAMAALRLLHRMHTQHRWVHGKSHLGNFMYMKGKIYAIEFERSFASADPIQHLLDIQFLFGHVSGVLLNPVHNNWDMHDILGLYLYRHPLMSRSSLQGQEGQQLWTAKSSNFSRRKTLYMLPICTCFARPSTEHRLKGCDFCKSRPNASSAAFVKDHFEMVMQDMSEWGLCKMKDGLKFTRTETITKQVRGVVDVIHPCIQSSSILGSCNTIVMAVTVENSNPKKRKLVQIDAATSFLNAELVSNLTRSKQSCGEVLKKLLYMPFVNGRARNIIKEVVAKLHYAGFTRAGDLLWANVAPAIEDRLH